MYNITDILRALTVLGFQIRVPDGGGVLRTVCMVLQKRNYGYQRTLRH